VSTVVGLKSVETDMVDLVRSMGARTVKIMLRVREPSALPQMFAGFKIAVCLSVVGAIVGEFVGSDRGLGYLLLTSTGTLDGPLIWAALIVLIAMGMTLFAIVSVIERLAIPWHVSVRLEDAAYQSLQRRPPMITFSRRSLIASAAAGLGTLSVRPARAADTVSFRLDWTLSGYHLPFYWAKDKGYYGAENLDVDIKEGAGSGKTVALMSGQQDDIGLADYMFMSVGVAKGMKLKGIFGEVQDGAWAVISRADSPIKKPADLIGRSVATTADHKAMLDLLLAVNKIPADKVTIQVTSPATRNTVFVNGQVDSFISVVIGSPLDLVVRAQQGKDKPVYFMPFAEFGIAPMGQGLLAHDRVIAEKPEMLRRFVRASAKALNEIVKPEKTEEAVDVAMRLSGARDERRESVKLQCLETTRRLTTKNTEGHPLGWMSDKDWAVSVDILVKTGQLEKPIQTQSLYTNEFVRTK